MNRDGLNAAASSLSVVGVAGLFLPSLSELYKTSPKAVPSHMFTQIRTGERVYLGFAVLVGGLHSLTSRSWVPLLLALALALGLIALYENALRQDPNETPADAA